MMTLAELPLVPSTVRLLTNPEIERLEAADSSFYVPTGSGVQRRCVTCRGEGDFRWWDEGRREIVTYQCPCHEQWRLYALFRNAGLDVGYQTWDWKDAEGIEDSAFALIDDYLAKPVEFVRAGVGLYLYGDYGTGKTMLSVLALKGLIAHGFEGHFISIKEMLNTYIEGWRDNEAARWFDRRVKNVDILVIDDLGTETEGNKIVKAAIDGMLRHRLGARKPTILTSNKDSDKIAGKYGANVSNLLNEAMRHYEFRGESWRGRAGTRLEEEIRQGLQRPVVVG